MEPHFHLELNFNVPLKKRKKEPELHVKFANLKQSLMYTNAK